MGFYDDNAQLNRHVCLACIIRHESCIVGHILCIIYAIFLSKNYWTLGLPNEVLSNHTCGPSVRPCVGLSVFEYLRDCLLFFSEILHEVRKWLSKKSDTA